ncbi:5-(carboxyamino)imidazole ribonucleotide synthase [Siccirubricoccus sp. KC 17139]|uniref:N5-carboxyaminoimidazole ribonucleotide synthase n=1 Tax=Siccirubricoccus soli TaxID=2899147 RepID=A0ABT1DCD8_9PROT|nr:5-(carboxyamino)imidazole ribonucleotide synthase [Siccirubricoccus soli]MCO6419569.1 5-(carboxyamino)imidazole ribonucleotide synthase [Siccirubricoccus soli]MCP2685704.1 5-(carboxyamino)imidazole ribonucleotide synthase [Siccirubricoccus soli]
MTPLPPGATIGILGGGQLGRMSALAAARLGYRCHVYAPEPDGPGMQVAAAHTVAPYEDAAALARFAAAVDVVTFEFENVPAATLAALAPLAPCRPGVEVLRVCQDRLAEKAFLERAGVPVAAWRGIESEAALLAALAEIGLPAVLKTTRLGYDGRGQALLRSEAEARDAFARLAPHPLILEAFVPFVAELSAVVARGEDGRTAVYDAVENRHRRHILDLSFAPARVPQDVGARARAHAVSVAESLGLVGVLALELFLLPDGTLLGNEIAPRPHNSGHWTMDACAASQFEQHVRAVAGLPLASPARHHDAVMKNLVGPEGMTLWPRLLAMPGVVPHLYGKGEARPGRKLGHANRLFPRDSLAQLPEASLLDGL